MKIFITVGTTNFDSLIEYLDTNLNREFEVLFQIAQGTYRPKNFKYINFTEKIDALYAEYDYIITHAGSGTIYKLLDLKKKFIAIPNLERVDTHQTDIAQFLKEEHYALSCSDFKDIIPSLEKLPSLEFNIYKKETFFKANEICTFIQQNM
ncbi:MAG: hypothetical protein L3J43_10580 [Sulfurovum sp.]|nr:hypothetical protein [Sulfurovum sp.]